MESTKAAVVVTGASRGIGAATALALAREGHPVCVNYSKDAVGAAQVVERILADGGRAIAHAADVSDEAAVEALFAACIHNFGPIGGLVNNAGILARQSRLDAMDLARLQRVFAVNVFGTMLCAREAVRHMARSRGGAGGTIVNVSSAAARLGSPGEYVDYAASKGAVDTFTIGLSKEVAGEGIRVNAVRPGFIDTDIHASGGEPGRIERLGATIPLGRGGRPEEVANAIVWLMSGDASYTTGALLDVSGGR
jgi:NAD(P)-dependent dehydrogenase (short-subunit alcohol dehydrogenase family)